MLLTPFISPVSGEPNSLKERFGAWESAGLLTGAFGSGKMVVIRPIPNAQSMNASVRGELTIQGHDVGVGQGTGMSCKHLNCPFWAKRMRGKSLGT